MSFHYSDRSITVLGSVTVPAKHTFRFRKDLPNMIGLKFPKKISTRNCFIIE